MNSSTRIDVASLAAFDVHVHLEATDDRTAADIAAKKYFGESGAARDGNALAEYYRSRKMAFVIFAVDEKLTGRTRVTNEEVVQFAEQNADVAIPFASIDPNRGAEGVQEARRLVSEGEVRGLKLHPPVQKFVPNDPIAYPLYEVFAEAGVPCFEQREKFVADAVAGESEVAIGGVFAPGLSAFPQEEFDFSAGGAE